MNVGDILRFACRNFPSKECLVCDDERYTYAELNERINRLADSLMRMGLGKGDNAAIMLHNCNQVTWRSTLLWPRSALSPYR